MAATAKVDISQEGSSTVFTVTPGGARRQWPLVQAGGTFLFFGWIFREPAGPVVWVAYVLGGLMVLLGLADQRPQHQRQKSVIRASRNGLEVNGKLYPQQSLRRLLVRNPLKSNEPARTITFTGPSAADVAAQVNAHMAWEREWAALVDGTYEIILDADHKDTVIAGNLSAQSVDRLLRSLCDATGMTYRT